MMTCITIKNDTVWLNKPAFRHILNNITPIVKDDEWVGGSRALEQIDISDFPKNLHEKICQTIKQLCYDDVLKDFKDELLTQLKQ